MYKVKVVVLSEDGPPTAPCPPYGPSCVDAVLFEWAANEDEEAADEALYGFARFAAVVDGAVLFACLLTAVLARRADEEMDIDSHGSDEVVW